MADIRINALPTTATDFASDDYIAIDGTTNGTRKLNAKTANLTFSDVTLGSSGPSVKSTLSARAPRQGLVFDGTAGGSGTLASAVGTSDFSIDAVFAVPSAANFTGPGITGIGNVGTANALSVYIYGSDLYVTLWGATGSDFRSAIVANVVTNLGGKVAKVSVIRNSATPSLTIYLNGVSASFTESTGGTAPTWAGSVSSTTVYVGKLTTSGNYFTGLVSGPLLYNRALSASEVVALYEAGAPSGADYNSATNTALNVATFANSNIYPYGTFSGASTTGFTAVSNGTGFQAAYANTSLTFKTGTKYRLTYTLTLNSGAAPFFVLGNPGVAGYSTAVQLSAGTNSVEVTATSSGTSAQGFGFQHNSSAGNYSISNISLVPVGLLLAPDAAQAGGGLVWYDTSGNAANITLPASGVSWNVPSSSKVATGWSYTGALNTTKVGAGSSVLNMGFFAGTTFAVAATDGIGIGDSGAGAYKLIQSYGGAIALNPGGNNVWIGKNSDSANGVLQLATHTTSAGGIGFGTDTSLYRIGTGWLALDSTGGDNPNLWFRESGSSKATVQSYLGDLYISTVTSGKSMYLRTGVNTTALTLDSSQRATFSTNLGGNGFCVNVNNAGGNTVFQMLAASSAAHLRVLTNGSLNFITGGSDQTLGTTALTLDSSQRCILSGALRLANTYVATPQVSTGYVTIQDSTGTTYKVLVAT